MILGVDIGGTKTALLCVADERGEVLHEERFPTPADSPPEHLLAEIEARIAEPRGRSGDSLTGIGVAVAGPVDDAGVVLEAGNLTGFVRYPLAERLAQRFGCPSFVEHDANAAALGERWRGRASRMRNFVFLSLGTGLGAGLVLDGRLYRGAHHAAGEVGNIVPDRRRLHASDSESRTMGQLLGGRQLRARARAAVGEYMQAAQSVRAGVRGDPRLAALAAEVSDYLALVVIDIGALLDPEAIFFGGGTAEAGEALLAEVRQRVEGELPVTPDLQLSGLGERAQLFGAIWGAARACRRIQNEEAEDAP